jgi:hypothetical protein
MISKIIKQIWNQRRMNGWIFIEVIIAGFFLWTVIDPMYVLMVNRFEPKGYEEEGRYVLNLGAYGNNHGMRDTTVTNNMRKEAFYRFIQLIQEQPEVESAYVSLYSSMPNSMSWSGGEYKPDTLSTAEEKITHTQNYYILGAEGCDIFRTLGIKDVHTGKELTLPEDASARDLCFISKQFALKMFGTTQAVGEKIFDYENQAIEIGAVFQDIKTRDYSASYPLMIRLEKNLPMNNFFHRNNCIVFRLKEGVDFNQFNERFKKEVAPHMSQGNFYFDGFQSFADLRNDLGVMNGVYNKLRLKGSLAIFTLLCIFLGMVGTFWIRCNARRQEIGLMRSIGATEERVRNQFLTEAGILVTAAFILSLVLVVNLVVMTDGMSQQNVSGQPEFALVSKWLSSGVQFIVVSLITYLALLLIALVGTLIPVRRAVRVLPADALRDE